MKYSPSIIAGLFLDKEGYDGLLFWYDAIAEMNKPPETKKKK